MFNLLSLSVIKVNDKLGSLVAVKVGIDVQKKEVYAVARTSRSTNENKRMRMEAEAVVQEIEL